MLQNHMYANIYCDHFCKTKVSLNSIEKAVLETQVKIYQASKRFEESIVQKEQQNFLIRQDIFLLIAKKSIEAIKKIGSSIYLRKLCLLSYIALFSSNDVNFCGLTEIKIRIGVYTTGLLLSPEFEAVSKSVESASVKNHAAVCLKDHISNISLAEFSESIYSLILNFDESNSRSTSIVKSVSCLGKLINFHNKLSFRISYHMLSKTIDASAEWYLYINGQCAYCYTCLYTAQESQLFCLLYCSSFSDHIIKSMSRFLSGLKINLKRIKCKLHKYIKHIIHMCTIDCLFKDNTGYSFRCSNQMIKNLISAIKQKLYRKNHQGYWRIVKHDSSYGLIQQIEKILYSWNTDYLCVLDELEILEVNRLIDYIFYKWQMKQS